MYCTTCRTNKPETDFPEKKLGGRYKTCVRCRVYNAEYKQRNKEKINACKRVWRKANPEKVYAYHRSWAKENPDRIRAIRSRSMEKTLSVPKNRIRNSITRGIGKALKGGKAGRSWEKLVGYTIKDLMAHLSKKFKDGMSFENHGEWHIDHIIPIAAFNFSTAEHEDFKRCWALSNLQPLWAGENFSKNSKLDKPFQPRLELAV